MDRAGYLVGVRGGHPYGIKTVSGIDIPYKLLAEEYDSHVIQSTVKKMKKKYPDLDVKSYEEFNFVDGDGHLTVATATRLVDEYGIDWLIVTALKKNVIMQSALTASIVSAVISVVAIVISTVISLSLGLIVTYPLKRLSREMRRIANMEFKESSFKKSPFSLAEFQEVCEVFLMLIAN
jgi:methyl-accepting chemotaxis protein